jgi:hypothetical protein
MPNYIVKGTIELNYEVTVEADDMDEAEERAKQAAEDGHGLDIPTGNTDVYEVTEVVEAKQP